MTFPSDARPVSAQTGHVRFGAKQRQPQNQALNQILALIPEKSKNSTGIQHDNTLNAGPGRPPIPLYPTKTRQEFATLIMTKENPEETARIASCMITDLGLGHVAGIATVYSLVDELSLAQLRELEDVGHALKEMGLFNRPLDFQAPQEFFLLVKALIKDDLFSSGKGFSPQTLWKMPELISTPFQLKGKQKQSFQKIPSDVAGCLLNIVNSLMDHTLESRKQLLANTSQTFPLYTSLSFPESLGVTMKAVQTLQAHQTAIPEIQDITYRLMAMCGTLKQFTHQTEQLDKLLTGKEGMASYAARMIYAQMDSVEKINTVLKIVKDFNTAGGDGNKLAELLTLREKPYYTVPQLKRAFDGSGEILARYKNPYEHRVLMETMEAFWEKTPEQFPMRFLAMADVLARTKLAISPNMMDDAEKILCLERILDNTPTAQAFSLAPEQMQDLERGIDSQELMMIQLGSLLRTSGDLSVTLAGKRMMELWHLNEYSFEMERFIPTLNADFIVREIHNGLINKVPPECYAVAVDSMKGLADRIEEDGEKLDNFHVVLEHALKMLGNFAIPPDEFGTYVEVLQKAVHGFPAYNAKKILLSITNLSENEEVNAIPRLRQIGEIFKAFRQNVNFPNAMSVLELLWEYALCDVDQSRWENYLNGLPEFLNKLSPKLVQDFEEPNNSLNRFFFAAIEAMDRDGNQLTLPQLLEAGFQARKQLKTAIPVANTRTQLAVAMLKRTRQQKDLKQAIEALTRLSQETGGPEPVQDMDRIIRFVFGAKRGQVILNAITSSTNPSALIMSLLPLSGKPVSSKKLTALVKTIEGMLEANPTPEYATALPRMVSKLKIKALQSPILFKLALEVLAEEKPGAKLPLYLINEYASLYLIDETDEKEVSPVYDLENVNPYLDKSDFESPQKPEKLVDPLENKDLERIRINLKALTTFTDPTRFLNHVMLNLPSIDPEILAGIYNFVDQTSSKVGLPRLPELMALLGPYADLVRNLPEKERLPHMSTASEGLTRLYNFTSEEVTESGITIDAIDTVQGIALNNWARVGALGLSFTKWQYDAMSRWKGLGPSEKPPLLIQSGQFKATPPRENDATYFRGFLRYDPQSQISIECRRAYIVISKPGLGTLVIRNSSPVFGRDLLEEPAYYHPEVTYTQGDNLFNPDSDLKQPGFEGIFSKKLHQTPEIQEENHKKIEALLNVFDESVDAYVDWKCGFKEGKPPEGFKEFLRSALSSARNDGAMSPFGKKKNIKLAWVNRHGLPFAVKSYDVSSPRHQAEMDIYLKVLERQLAIPNTAEYALKIPDLLAFLQEGLSKNLELVLTE